MNDSSHEFLWFVCCIVGLSFHTYRYETPVYLAAVTNSTLLNDLLLPIVTPPRPDRRPRSTVFPPATSLTPHSSHSRSFHPSPLEPRHGQARTQSRSSHLSLHCIHSLTSCRLCLHRARHMAAIEREPGRFRAQAWRGRRHSLQDLPQSTLGLHCRRLFPCHVRHILAHCTRPQLCRLHVPFHLRCPCNCHIHSAARGLRGFVAAACEPVQPGDLRCGQGRVEVDVFVTAWGAVRYWNPSGMQGFRLRWLRRMCYGTGRSVSLCRGQRRLCEMPSSGIVAGRGALAGMLPANPWLLAQPVPAYCHC